MSNVFKNVADKFKHSPFAIPVAGACLIGIVISVFLFLADYRSSLAGYQRLPTAKIEEAEWAVALSLQIGQIIFLGMYTLSVEQIGQTRNKANTIYIIVWLFLLLGDLGTDMWYKTFEGTASFGVWVIAFIESVAFYTIGSEMLFIASIGLLVYVLPAAKAQLEFVISDLSGRDTKKPSGMR